jgi:hypothetical protein
MTAFAFRTLVLSDQREARQVVIELDRRLRHRISAEQESRKQNNYD